MVPVKSLHKKIYALLIGINDYPLEQDHLGGCLNDVNLMEVYLNNLAGDDRSLSIQKLLNREATYKNVITGIRGHLGKAGKGDFVYLHYSGHGCRQRSAPEFADQDHSYKDEVLCVYDIDQLGYGLADKELAVLLAELDQKGAHITVVMDCCHSGSTTRTWLDEWQEFSGSRIRRKVKVGKKLKEARPLDTYLDGYYQKQLSDSGRVTIPTSRHILLAACNKQQTAGEITKPDLPIVGKIYGALTWSMVQTLKNVPDKLSYKQLHHQVKSRVAAEADRLQWPQLEAFGKFNSEWCFLNDFIVGRPRRFRVAHNSQEDYWRLNGGCFNGIEDGTAVAVLDGDGESVIAEARVNSARFDFSLLYNQAGLNKLNKSREYGVRVVDRPSMPVVINLKGTDSEVQAWQNHVQKEEFYLADYTASENAARFQLELSGGGFLIRNLSTGKEVGRSRYHKRIYEQLQAVIRHLYYWERVAGLQNLHSSFQPEDVVLVFQWQENGKWRSDPDGFCAIDIQEKDGQRLPVPYKIVATNKTSIPLSLLLLYQDEKSFRIRQLSTPEVQPGGSVEILSGLEMSLDPEYDVQQERFKLLFAAQKVDLDPGQFELAPIDSCFEAFRTTRGDRGIGLEEDDKRPPRYVPRHMRWQARSLIVQMSANIAEIGRKDIQLPGGLRISSHPEFAATLSLDSRLDAASRGESALAPPLPAQARPLSLGIPRSATASPRSLYLSGINDTKSISSATPLTIELPNPVSPDSLIVPVAGSNGIWTALPNRQGVARGLQVSIEHLPKGDRQRGVRSLRSALQLAFLKIALRKPDVDRFRRVVFSEDGEVIYLENDLPEAVKRAENIYLVLHGIIGDSTGQSRGLAQALAAVDAPLRPEKDLLLTYDYENLNSGIADVAVDLLRHLRQVGLADSGKKLSIIAHSMGGLVARWMIEHPDLKAGKFVQRLISVGTPHGGSRWGTITQFRNFLTAAFSFSLNTIGIDIPVLGWMLKLLQGSEALTVSLEEMQPQSQLLRQLSDFADPGVPYTLIGGNALADGYMKKALHERIFAAMAEAGGDLLYKDEPNDFAVAVKSALAVSERRNPAPQKIIVSCSHLDYFRSPASLRRIGEVLRR